MMLVPNMSNHSAILQLGNVTNHFLVVKDEEPIRELLVLGLQEDGFKVVAVGQTTLTLSATAKLSMFKSPGCVKNSQLIPFNRSISLLLGALVIGLARL
jgi:hypothetical protein